MPLSMCFFVNYIIDLTTFLFHIFHSLESLPGILVGRAIALGRVDKAATGDRVSTHAYLKRVNPNE